MFVLFFVLTSAYCLLAYIPFTYLQFLRHDLVPWIAFFAAWHHWLYWPAAGLACLTVWGGAKRLTAGFLVISGAVGVVLVVRPVLPSLGNDAASGALGLAALVPVLWVAAIDLAAAKGTLVWSWAGAGEDRRLFWTAVQSALFLAFVHAGIFFLRTRGAAGAGLVPAQAFAALVFSVVLHLVAFASIFVVLSLVRGLAPFAMKPARCEFWLTALLLAGIIAFTSRRLIFAAISFAGRAADLFALAIGVTLAASLAGLALKLLAAGGGQAVSGVEALLGPLTPFAPRSPSIPVAPRGSASLVSRAVQAAPIALLAGALAAGTGGMDWNFLLQKLAALAIWALTFAAFYAMNRRPTGGRDLALPLVLAAASSVGAYRAIGAGGWRIGASLGGTAGSVEETLETYAGFEPSFRLIRDGLAPLAQEDSGFYEFLERHTNISRDVVIAPVDVNFVPALSASPGEKPSIFIFVIDSLRRDYLSPYNPSVTFTPLIARFASENVVFTNAFTHYGATGLAEPSIWVGGLLVHKQYVTPFYPMNTLQKLIRAERYEPLLSMDSILRTIVAPASDIVDLDEGLQNKDFGFCRSLASLQSKLAGRRELGRPIFVYSQPQDIHVSVITREGASVPHGESYPGFYAPYASRIRKMDACFGEFIAELKSRGLYEQSVVILTSDHGDSLGEEGRWGHAYTLYPEIVKIPLIVHLPAGLQSRLVSEPAALSFSTDITPTLYYLLGHRPALRSDLFGRALFTETRREQADRGEGDHLMASSYGPVYGILRDGGRSLYVVDAINYADEYFDLDAGLGSERKDVTAAMRAEFAAIIRAKIREIDGFYHVTGLD